METLLKTKIMSNENKLRVNINDIVDCGDKLYYDINLNSKMDVPSFFYERLEKEWVKWRESKSELSFYEFCKILLKTRTIMNAKENSAEAKGKTVERWYNELPYYRTVAVIDRLPEIANENYLTISERGIETARFFNGTRFETAYYEGKITHWLEKMPPLPE